MCVYVVPDFYNRTGVGACEAPLERSSVNGSES